jgi:hypothetical protein
MHQWEGNIRMDIEEKGYEDGDWIYLIQNMDQRQAVLKAVMNLLIP